MTHEARHERDVNQSRSKEKKEIFRKVFFDKFKDPLLRGIVALLLLLGLRTSKFTFQCVFFSSGRAT